MTFAWPSENHPYDFEEGRTATACYQYKLLKNGRLVPSNR